MNFLEKLKLIIHLQRALALYTNVEGMAYGDGGGGGGGGSGCGMWN
jgi:hypothetical protein